MKEGKLSSNSTTKTEGKYYYRRHVAARKKRGTEHEVCAKPSSHLIRSFSE